MQHTGLFNETGYPVELSVVTDSKVNWCRTLGHQTNASLAVQLRGRIELEGLASVDSEPELTA
jgi:hypothetical protein